MKFVLYILACVAAVSVFISDAQAQMSSVEIDILRLKFRNFEYDSVITLAAKLLQERESLSTADQIKVLEMKAISHYSLLEMNASLSCFLEILKLDSSYELDPIKTSPKILSFFNEIKAGFQQEAASPPAARPTRQRGASKSPRLSNRRCVMRWPARCSCPVGGIIISTRAKRLGHCAWPERSLSAQGFILPSIVARKNGTI